MAKPVDKKSISIWYDPEVDILEVMWAKGGGLFNPLDQDDRILEGVDDDGNALGFMIHEFSSMDTTKWVKFDVGGTPPPNYVEGSVGMAARDLGVSEGRVRQLVREGRIVGARKIGRDWLIRLPAEVIPGKRGPEGTAGKARNGASSPPQSNGKDATPKKARSKRVNSEAP